MSTQFIHLETYSRKADRQGRSVAFVLAEAAREPWACYHVEQPRPPTVLHGIHPSEVRFRHDQRAASTRIQTSTSLRALRQDQHTLLTLVASFHRNGRGYDCWERNTLKWLQVRYGSQLASVIRHTDESHPHLHAYVLPDDPDMRARRLHPGAIAKDTALHNGLTNKAGDAAYRSAMRAFQDAYWLDICAPLGIQRLGPSRRRMSRAEWLREKTAQECKRAANMKISKDMQRINTAKAQLVKWREELEQWQKLARSDIAKMQREIKREIASQYHRELERLRKLYEEERDLREELQARLEQEVPEEKFLWQHPTRG